MDLQFIQVFAPVQVKAVKAKIFLVKTPVDAANGKVEKKKKVVHSISQENKC